MFSMSSLCVCMQSAIKARNTSTCPPSNCKVAGGGRGGGKIITQSYFSDKICTNCSQASSISGRSPMLCMRMDYKCPLSLSRVKISADLLCLMIRNNSSFLVRRKAFRGDGITLTKV